MNVKIECYSPDGFKMTLEHNVPSHHAAQRFAQDTLRAGFTPTAPDIGKRQNQIITTVIRREHLNDDGTTTPVVDLYPSWGVRDYGQFRFSFIYLNSDDAIREFESHAGLKLAELPLLESQQPLKRHPKHLNKHEVKCKPFVAVKEYEGEKEIGGKVQQTWKFIRYGEMPAVAAPDPAPSATPQRPALPPQTARPRATLPPAGTIRPAVSPNSAIPINQSAPLSRQKSS